jgi:hypothetical protein
MLHRRQLSQEQDAPDGCKASDTKGQRQQTPARTLKANAVIRTEINGPVAEVYAYHRLNSNFLKVDSFRTTPGRRLY